MCLSEIGEERINDLDFNVYKVVRKINGGYYTPFFLNPVMDINYSELLPRFDKILGKVVINKGIHSFIYLSDAELFKEHLINRHGNEYVIFKCIIPINARYYMGRFEYNVLDFNCIASDQLIYSYEI